MKDKFWPIDWKIAYIKLSKGRWVCRFSDFFDDVIFTGRGRTRDEVRGKCCRYRDEWVLREATYRRDKQLPRGEKWTREDVWKN